MMSGDLGAKKPTAKSKVVAKAAAKAAPTDVDPTVASVGSADPNEPTAEEKHILDNLNEHSFTRNVQGKDKLKLFIRLAWPKLWEKFYGEKIATMTVDDRTFGWDSLAVKVVVWFEKEEKYGKLSPLAWRDAVYEEVCRVSPAKANKKVVTEQFVKQVARLAKQSLPKV